MNQSGTLVGLGGYVGDQLKVGPARGWECPKCERVYAPSQPLCMFCGPLHGAAITGSTFDKIGPPPLGR